MTGKKAEQQMNILDYVRRANTTFAHEPFNNVDSLVLCQLFYVRVEELLLGEGLALEEPGYRLSDFYKGEYFDRMFSDGITDESNHELFAYAVASPRFRDIRVKYISASTDPGAEKQFAAATFAIGEDTEYIVFRGTDGSMLGWKEDFNLSFMDEIPSQSEAVDYINEHFGAGGAGRDKRLYIGGHSKGGNLAVYGAAMCDACIHDRIVRVYSLEGPGFREDVADRLRGIAERDSIEICKLVPQGSLIGMIMETTEDVSVVESVAVGIMQHSAYTWQVAENDFVYRDDLSYSGTYNDRALRIWLEKFDDRERALFVDTVFDILKKNDIYNLNDIKSITPAKTVSMFATYSDLDRDTRKFIHRVIKGLISAHVKAVPNEEVSGRLGSIAEKAERVTENIRTGYEEWREKK